MRLIIDENAPVAVAAFFVERGHEVIDIREHFGTGLSDSQIANYGDRSASAIVTWDRDFKKLVSRAPIGQRAQFRRLGRISFDCAPIHGIHRIRALINVIEFAYNDSLTQNDARFIVDISETTLRLIR